MFAIFSPMETGMNIPVLRLIYSQFNCSLHVEITYIEFEDKVLMKPKRM